MKPAIFIIEDDSMMAECFASVLSSQGNYRVRTFSNALAATAALDSCLPDLIILDILLSGPDGFTFLNETISYQDTARIPIIITSSLNLENYELDHYGVIATLSKETLTPHSLLAAVKRGLEAAHAI